MKFSPRLLFFGIVLFFSSASTAQGSYLPADTVMLPPNGLYPNATEVDGETAGYGSLVSPIGDLDGNGVQELLVGARVDGDKGAAYIHFMKSDGGVLHTKKISPNTTNGASVVHFSAHYGYAVSGIGDIDDNGVDDIAITAINETPNSVYLHSLDNSGGVLATISINANTPNGPVLTQGNGAEYGSSIVWGKDFDGDGIKDMIVGAQDEGDDGAIFIHLLNGDYSIKATHKIDHATPNGPVESGYANEDDAYGSSLAVYDIDGDGNEDIIVGSEKYNDEVGAVYVHYMNANLSIRKTELMTSAKTNLRRFGSGVAVFSDGRIAIGSRRGYVGFYKYREGQIKYQNDGLSSETFGLGTDYGSNISIVGDMNGDNVQDLAISDHDIGEVYIHISSADIPIYRIYNTKTGVHLYTRGVKDRDAVLVKWPEFEFTDGGPAFYAALSNNGLTPIYRLYNTKSGVHLYTRGEADKNKILAKFSDFEFTDGVPAFYANLADDGTTPIYRLYNTKSGVHLYTRGEADKNKILAKFSDFEFTDGAPAFYLKIQ